MLCSVCLLSVHKRIHSSSPRAKLKKVCVWREPLTMSADKGTLHRHLPQQTVYGIHTFGFVTLASISARLCEAPLQRR